MEEGLTTYLLQYLLDHAFKSKAEMSRELKVSKRVIQRLLNDPSHRKGGTIALENAIVYCTLHSISIDFVLKEYIKEQIMV